MLNDLNWQPLQIRRKNKSLIVFHKAVNQNSPVEIPDYVTQSTYSGTRSHSNAFIEIRANYEQYKNSFLPRTIKDWNALPTHLVHVTSVDEFGSRQQSLIWQPRHTQWFLFLLFWIVYTHFGAFIHVVDVTCLWCDSPRQ